MREKGFRKMEAYTPYPIQELEEFIEGGRERCLPLIVLIGGILGTLTAWVMQYYIAVIDYPINVGGRPLNSWPSFIVIMFELTILFAALTTFFGMLALCGLPAATSSHVQPDTVSRGFQESLLSLRGSARPAFRRRDAVASC